MKSIIYIIPYFGKMGNLFPLWLRTCALNPSVNWIIFTDNYEEYSYPPNVRVVHMSFKEVVKKFQNQFDFPICLDTPYKLCDFKPAYGEVFSDYIQNFDFWGHCDIDLLWGDIRNFITEKVLEENDKIGFLGHSTLYRNTPEVNARYKITGKSKVDYKEAFSSSENFFFDERVMNEIYDSCGWRCYKKQVFADLSDYYYKFFLTNVAAEEQNRNNRQIFFWEKGKLIRKYLLNNKVHEDTFMYIHFLKRKMEINVEEDAEQWMIIPNKITDKIEESTIEVVKKYSKSHWGKYFWNLFHEKKDQISPKKIFTFLVKRSKKYYCLKKKNDTLNERKM